MNFSSSGTAEGMCNSPPVHQGKHVALHLSDSATLEALYLLPGFTFGEEANLSYFAKTSSKYFKYFLGTLHRPNTYHPEHVYNRLKTVMRRW